MQDDKYKINKVRLCADSGKFDSPKNDLTNLPISFRAGDSVCLDIVLLHNGKIVDCSKFSTITLEILDIGSPNSPLPRNPRLLVKKVVETSQVQTALTQEEFASGESHLSFLLDSTDTSLNARYHYMKLCAFDDVGNRTTFASGWIFVEKVYGSEILQDKEEINFVGELESLVNRQIARVDETLEEFSAVKDELKVINENKADKSTTLSGYNIDNAYTKTEADLKFATTTSTQDLQLFKSNSGALHYSGGMVTTTLKNLGDTFSIACIVQITQERFDAIPNYTHFYGTSFSEKNPMCIVRKVSSNQCGFLLKYIENEVVLGSAEIVFSASRLTDGKPHSLVCISNKGVLSVYVDETKVVNGDIGYSGSINLINPMRLGYGTSVNINSISNFSILNFDVSDATSPYTLADYQQGKPIPPLLLKGTQKVLDNNYTDWDIYNTSNFEISQDSNADTITATCISPTNYCTFTDDWKSGLKAGDVVSVSWESIEVSSGVSVIGTITNTATNGSVEIANGGTFVQQADSQYIYFQANLSSNVSVGDTITVKGLRIRVNGALLSLENYTITNGTTQQIFDYSGNANDATCSGTIKGDNDSRIARLVDFIKA